MPPRREHITEILRQRLLRGVQAGSLSEGDRLPSARELEKEFDTDHRIVLAAYRQLAEEGLVEMRPRGGIYVAASPGVTAGMPAISAAWLTDVLTQGIAREVPVLEMHEWLRRSVETLRLRAVVVAGTEDQIGGLVRELRDDFGLEASGIHAASLGADGDVPLALRRADIIVVTEAYGALAQRMAADLGKPCITMAVRPDLIGGEWRLLLRRPVYVVVADEKFGSILSRFFAGTPGAKNIRVMQVGRDDLSAIPNGVPVYVTQKAREALGPTPLRGRVLPAARTISRETAREIIDFIVRANLQAITRRAE